MAYGKAPQLEKGGGKIHLSNKKFSKHNDLCGHFV
ncbi:hypothetical protein METH_17630 [Leisingera methylohalidivorans DSM 14336]|uniref:Uncharacterized protein n=1 Tax=Leisingera methylohalidivorans DSM 14336 TaxID=999552 RepID=V9VZR1_9RHOB|nr:hypothetical protein METH_17630 [Leisingera methylohalidivorans DSM 14336]